MEQKQCLGCMKHKQEYPVCEHCGYDERTANAPHQLQTGTVLQGRYLVGRALGQGGFGITYLGWNQYLETRVAIKEYYPSVFVERNATYNTSLVCKTQKMVEPFQENRMRFLREARTLAKLQEVPQIVSIHDFFEVNNTAYIVMEYLQGSDLRDYVKKRGGRLTAAETLSILRPVMAALVKVHEAGLVHRDISPDNIMLQHDGSVKLMDFGAVRTVNNPDVDKELTQATQAIVKRGFAPIEQYSEKGSIGPWTDEYALCATVYYCMTGRVPESAPDRIMEGSELDWEQIDGLTTRQKQILRKGTAIHAKDRYSSIRELMDALFAQTAQADAELEAAKREAERKEAERREAERLEAEWQVAIKWEAECQPAVKRVEERLAAAKREAERIEVAKLEAERQAAAKREAEKQKASRKSDKKGMTVLLGAILLAAVIFILLPRGWAQNNGEWYYYQNGMKVTGWWKIDNCYYHFDSDGTMQIGWQQIDDNKYYFDLSDNYGSMATGWQTINGSKYYFDTSDNYGSMMTGWQTIDGSRYYFSGYNGEMLTGFRKIGGDKYYFDQNGKMLTGTRHINGAWYRFASDGKLIE